MTSVGTAIVERSLRKSVSENALIHASVARAEAFIASSQVAASIVSLTGEDIQPMPKKRFVNSVINDGRSTGRSNCICSKTLLSPPSGLSSVLIRQGVTEETSAILL